MTRVIVGGQQTGRTTSDSSYVEDLVADDGTGFQVNSEQVRGERRIFWIERKDVGSPRWVGDGSYEDTRSRRTAYNQLARRVEEWNTESGRQ